MDKCTMLVDAGPIMPVFYLRMPSSWKVMVESVRSDGNIISMTAYVSEADMKQVDNRTMVLQYNIQCRGEIGALQSWTDVCHLILDVGVYSLSLSIRVSSNREQSAPPYFVLGQGHDL